MKTLVMIFCLVVGVLTLGGCGSMVATDYVEMGAYVRTANEISGEVKGKGYCFLPEEEKGDAGDLPSYIMVLRKQFAKVGMREVSQLEEADFVVAVAYGLGEERMVQLPTRRIRTGSGGLGKMGYDSSAGFFDNKRDTSNFITPKFSGTTNMGGGVAVGRVKILALALVEGKEWLAKGEKSEGCYSGTVVVYGGGDGLEKLFPRMAGYLFEGFPGKKVSERVETFRVRAGEVDGEKAEKSEAGDQKPDVGGQKSG